MAKVQKVYTKDFEQILASEAFNEQVNADVEMAHAYGLTGVPALIFADHYLVMGAQPYQVLKQVVERVIEEEKGGGEGERQHGKPAGVRCLHLTHDHRCALYGKPERPEVCKRLRASEEMCGHTAREAFAWLAWVERATQRGRRSLASNCCIDYHTGGR